MLRRANEPRPVQSKKEVVAAKGMDEARTWAGGLTMFIILDGGICEACRPSASGSRRSVGPFVKNQSNWGGVGLRLHGVDDEILP